MALHKHFPLQSTFDHPQKCSIAKYQIAHLGLICPPERAGTLAEGSWGRFLSPSMLSGNKDLLLPLPGWLRTCCVGPCMAFLCCLGVFAQTPSTLWNWGTPTGMATSCDIVGEVHSTEWRGGLSWGETSVGRERTEEERVVWFPMTPSAVSLKSSR